MVLVYEKGEEILEIFKGTEGPYRIENERPWRGYIVDTVGLEKLVRAGMEHVG